MGIGCGGNKKKSSNLRPATTPTFQLYVSNLPIALESATVMLTGERVRALVGERGGGGCV